MKGRIVVVKEYGKPFEIEEYDAPEPQPRRVIRPDRKQRHCRKNRRQLAERRSSLSWSWAS